MAKFASKIRTTIEVLDALALTCSYKYRMVIEMNRLHMHTYTWIIIELDKAKDEFTKRDYAVLERSLHELKSKDIHWAYMVKFNDVDRNVDINIHDQYEVYENINFCKFRPKVFEEQINEGVDTLLLDITVEDYQVSIDSDYPGVHTNTFLNNVVYPVSEYRENFIEIYELAQYANFLLPE